MKLTYVVKVGNCFYRKRYDGISFEVTKDIQDAKWFYDKSTAQVIAKELSGEVRGVIDVMMEETE